MPLSIDTSISALQALGTKQAVGANNIANSASAGFKKSRVLLQEEASGTLNAKVQRVNTPGVMLNQPDGSLQELSNVDLGQELTEMIPTRHAYEANLKALQSKEQMDDAVIDLIG